MATTVIAVHGVGRPRPGLIGADVVRLLGDEPAERVDLLLNGHTYSKFINRESGDSVIEVNWSDILRPRSSAGDLFRFLAFIVTSMMDTAAEKLKNSSPLRLYRWALFTVTPGAVLVVTMGAIQVSVPEGWTRSWISLLLMAASVALAFWLQRLGNYFRWLWPWVVTAAVIATLGATSPSASWNWLLGLSKGVRAAGFAAVVGFLLLAALFVSIRFAKEGRDRWMAHLALLYIPFMVVNIISTWLSFLAMALLHAGWPDAYSEWEEAMNPGPSLFHAEVAATVVIGGLGILALLLPFLGYRFKWGGGSSHDLGWEGNAAGRGARSGLSLLLTIAPVALLVLMFYAIWATIEFHGDTTGPEILAIYRTSILRALPYLGLLVGPFAVAMDVIADVLFYVRPEDGHPASTRTVCRDRFRRALDFACQDLNGSVVVLAHSQGSVIAADVLAETQLPVTLFTVGSPVSALYARFLESPSVLVKAAGSSALRGSWANSYREGDYIGGPISLPQVENVGLGPGGHTGYWSDKRVRAWLEARAPQTLKD